MTHPGLNLRHKKAINGVMDKPSKSWSGLFWLTVVAAYAYIFIEWLFVVTKGSFLSMLSLFTRLQVLLFAGGLLTGLGLAILLVLFAVSRLPGLRNRPAWMLNLAALLPAFVCACLALIVADNFTYTVLHLGVVSFKGFGRLVYAILFLVILAGFYRELPRYTHRFRRLSAGRWMAAAVLFMAASMVLSLYHNELGPGARAGQVDLQLTRPINILYLTSDALQSSHMGMYGYARDTTPFLSRLANSSLLAENAYSNCTNTGGSLMAAFTSKYPAAMRLVTAPDILRGQDAYQHLPGMLHAAGYQTLQLSSPYYADSYALNLLQGFDRVNEQSIPVDGWLSRAAGYMPVDFSYFFLYTTNRIADRLKHIFFIHSMDNPYDLVHNGSLRSGDLHMNDFQRFLEDSPGRFFMHIHFTNTHGPVYFMDEQVFSAGKGSSKQHLWDEDFYDDAILTFDQKVEAMVDMLKARDLFDQTILIVSSDHAHQWNPVHPIPLLIHFPNGEYAGHYRKNAQVMDIAPTLLDYLDTPIPSWMQGRSLLQPEVERPILVASGWNIEADSGDEPRPWRRSLPPFYQFERMSLIYCQRWYILDLNENALSSGLIAESTNYCPQAEKEDPALARSLIVAHLKENGFDTSSLVAP